MKTRRAVALLSTASILALVFPPQSSVAATRCAGKAATIVGASGDETIVGTKRADVIVAPGGADTTIEGRGGNDRICSGMGSDIVLGGAGDDVMNGGSGIDALLGGRDDDRFNGGTGIDLAAFLDSPSGVTADLATGFANGRGRDSMVGIEGMIGSHYGDDLYGDAGLNVFFPGVGNDWVEGRAGDDFVLYMLAQSGVNIDLAGGTATGGSGSDALRSIENAVGSPFDDSMTGTDGPNYLDGDEGTDAVDGQGGQNICYAESAVNCADDLPTTTTAPTAAASTAMRLSESSSEPPSLPEGAMGAALDGAKAPSEGQVSRTASAASYMSCPALSGSAVLSYPNWTGYGYWRWRRTYPYDVATDWNYGPWLYYNGTSWIAHVYGNWYTVFNYATWPGGATHAFIQAQWYNYDTNTWYAMGECQTQTWHLIPGMYVVPR